MQHNSDLIDLLRVERRDFVADKLAVGRPQDIADGAYLEAERSGAEDA